MKILITGGAGFVGSHLAKLYQAQGGNQITVFDNLKRRGSELNLPDLKRRGIDFVHGDIRCNSDLQDLAGSFDLLVEASAEPSVHAGVSGSPNYLLQTNLQGTLNCLEFSRARVGNIIFLSTSRVYSLQPLKEIALKESATRLDICAEQKWPGVSTKGVSEEFATQLPRTLYGASKLASELVIQEYVDTFKMRAVINRCGVIAGPGQFGKVDQGVFTLWIANHYFGKSLRYTGFGGTGKQVRDLLHPRDLFALLNKQLEKLDTCSGEIFNVGGGLGISTSLLEWTNEAERVTGRHLEIPGSSATAHVDVPLYISDFGKVAKAFSWHPEVQRETIANEIGAWLRENETSLKELFCN